MVRAAMRAGRLQPSRRPNGPPRRLQVGAAAVLQQGSTLPARYRYPALALHGRTPHSVKLRLPVLKLS